MVRVWVMLWLLLWVPSWAQQADSFITKDEYAKMLYNAPRGISCAKCHGPKGEGKLISKYKHKGKERVLKTEPIYHLDFKSFKKGVLQSNSIMPRYYLTNAEIAALYYFLQSSNRKKEAK